MDTAVINDHMNNLESKDLMKFGQLQNKNIIKKIGKNWDLKTSFIPFCVCKELYTTSIEK